MFCSIRYFVIGKANGIGIADLFQNFISYLPGISLNNNWYEKNSAACAGSV